MDKIQIKMFVCFCLAVAPLTVLGLVLVLFEGLGPFCVVLAKSADIPTRAQCASEICGVGRQRFHCISGKKDRNRSDRHFTILESFYSLRLVRESEEICL